MDNKTTWHAIDKLCQLIDILGAGGQRFVQRALGIRSDGFLCRLAQARDEHDEPRFDIRLGRYTEIARILGVSPAALLTAPGEPILIDPLPAMKKADQAIQPVERAVVDALRRPDVLDKTIFAARLETIDDLRYLSPQQALSEIEKLAEEAGAGQVPYVLAVAASCYRMLAQNPFASRCLVQARQAAEAADDRLAIGEVYQRAVYFFNSIGLPSISLQCAEKATCLYAMLDHRRKIGESIVDQGFCFFQLGQHEKCIEIFHHAGKYEDALRERNRFARLLGTGRAFFELDRRSDALEYVIKAKESSPDPRFKAKALWAEGVILGESGIPEIKQAIDLQLETQPVDAALASLDLCKAYLDARRFSEAHDTARGMTLFVQPFLHVPAVTKALRDLVLIGTAAKGGLTLTLLEHVRDLISANRAHYYQRARLPPLPPSFRS